MRGKPVQAARCDHGSFFHSTYTFLVQFLRGLLRSIQIASWQGKVIHGHTARLDRAMVLLKLPDPARVERKPAPNSLCFQNKAVPLSFDELEV